MTESHFNDEQRAQMRREYEACKHLPIPLDYRDDPGPPPPAEPLQPPPIEPGEFDPPTGPASLPV